MERLGSVSSLRYSPDYFASLGTGLAEKLRVLTAFGQDGLPIASSLFSRGFSVDEYMLSCSDTNSALRGYASKLLIHHAAKLSKGEGAKALHLGGAPEGNNGLLDMKRRFGTIELQHFTMRVVGRAELYKELTRSLVSEPATTFPKYRAVR